MAEGVICEGQEYKKFRNITGRNSGCKELDVQGKIAQANTFQDNNSVIFTPCADKPRFGLKLMRRFFILCLMILVFSSALAENLVLSPGTHTSGEAFSPGYWYIQPDEGEIILMTYRLPESDEHSLILTGFEHPFDGAKVTTAIQMELPKGAQLTIYGGKAVLQPGQESLVWVSKSGTKYHRIADCSRMKDPISMPESEALAEGKTPCANCYK